MEWAYKRQSFKDHLESKLTGGLIEFYKATLVKDNKQNKWVDHWTSEYKRLFEIEFVSEVLHEITSFKDKKKAVEEVLLVMAKKDKSILTYAKNTVEKDFKIKIKSIPSNLFDMFLKEINHVISKIEL